MNTFVTEIRLEYRNRLVLHSHHHKALVIHRLHFTENNRNANKETIRNLQETRFHSVDFYAFHRRF
jgi:thiamine-phosphate pyrophosphorylase